MNAQERGRERLRKLRDEAGAPSVSVKSGKSGIELPVSDLEPNDWNPNVVDKQQMVKLRNGIKLLLDQGMRPPPVVVRTLAKGRYQIIDGYHRWTIFKDLKQETIPAFILNVDDKTARILTDTLNYLRGAPDEQKYSELVADLINTHGANLDELAGLLPETRDELADILAESEAGLKALLFIEEQERLATKEAEEVLNDENTWLDLTFRVSKSQASVIEREITRIEGTLDGKNRRGRALEFMAAMSSTTPLDQSPKTQKVKTKKVS